MVTLRNFECFFHITNYSFPLFNKKEFFQIHQVFSELNNFYRIKVFFQKSTVKICTKLKVEWKFESDCSCRDNAGLSLLHLFKNIDFLLCSYLKTSTFLRNDDSLKNEQHISLKYAGISCDIQWYSKCFIY